MDIIDDIDRGILPHPKLIDEKIGDSINYLVLLEALLYDRIPFAIEVEPGSIR